MGPVSSSYRKGKGRSAPPGETELRIEPLSLPLRLLAMLPKVATAPAATVPQTRPPAPAGPATTGVAAPSVEMLVMLAAAPGGIGRKAALAEAAAGLDRLERLRGQLVRGVLPAAEVAALAGWAAQLGRPEDADIAGLLRDLELRVLVEIAKQERGG